MIHSSSLLAETHADTSTLGDASFSVGFILKLNRGMVERFVAAQLKGQRKTQHRKAYERPAGLRPIPEKVKGKSEAVANNL